MDGGLRVAIAGGAGYAGGELLRLLLFHPRVAVAQVASRSPARRIVPFAHPNLRGHTELRFCAEDELERCAVLFLALPHGEAAREIERYAALAERVVDLSADFRLRSAAEYQRWYGAAHPHPAWLERFVYGLPELTRAELAQARWASGPGCNAAAATLALLPLLAAPEPVVDWGREVIVEAKVGSSEAGGQASDASHHPARAGVVRSFAPTGHRHTAEVEQALRRHGVDTRVHHSLTAVELVRGVLATAHVFLRPGVSERDVWGAYRALVAREPFLRLVKERSGVFRYPEPKLLAGTNIVELGFELDPATGRLVVLAALDNLMKGAAGTAVQAMNVMFGWPETTGLGFPGLHPV